MGNPFLELPNEDKFVKYLEEKYGVTNARRAVMRKVEFSRVLAMTGAERSVDLQIGWFHTWGIHSFPVMTDVARWTVAIVEAKDGQVYKVLPNRIKFVEGL